jgi:AGZA family xanthine/uracil permease-like MFS transporter
MATATGSRTLLDRYFHVSERGSTMSRELRGGLVTFVTMSYIVVLNPLVLGSSSPDDAAAKTDVTGAILPVAQVAAVTALVAGVMSVLFGIIANYPFAIATGLGINTLVAVTIAPQVTWPEAMGLVVVEGLVIVVLAATGLRTAVFTAVPTELKAAFCFGLLLMAVLVVRKVRGGLLIGIVVTTVLAGVVQAITHVGPSAGTNPKGWSLSVPSVPDTLASLPDLHLVGEFSLGAFARIGALSATLLVFTLVLANFFDAMGTMTGLGKEAGLVDEDGNLPGIGRALVVEGAGAVMGGAASSSSNTVFIESASGIAEGARTGLANVVTGVLFLAAMFLTPLYSVVPIEAAAPALVVVGALMVGQVREIDFSDFSVALPAFLTIVVMPFTYSIANGIGVGFITWVVLRAARGDARRTHPLLWVVALLFVVYFAVGPVTEALS